MFSDKNDFLEFDDSLEQTGLSHTNKNLICFVQKYIAIQFDLIIHSSGFSTLRYL